MTEEFVSIEAAYEIACRHEFLTKAQFLLRIVELGAAGQLVADGFRLVDGRYAPTVVREPVERTAWQGGGLVENQSRSASNRPAGWLLHRDGLDHWAGLRVRAEYISAAMAPKRRSLSERKRDAIAAAIATLGYTNLKSLRQKDRESRILERVNQDSGLAVSDRTVRGIFGKMQSS